jgi:peptidoglycan/xylan/chitin deacetylase (PgdA/CDA1 family)
LFGILTVAAGIWRMNNPSMAGSPAAGRGEVVALMYHRFVTPEQFASLTRDEQLYAIATDRFEAQLRRLVELGYRGLSLDEALGFAHGSDPSAQRGVLITIDDGCRSALELAGPLLKKHGLRATLFVTTDPAAHVFRGESMADPRLTDEELRDLDPAVFDVGGHGHSHRPLDQLADSDLASELSGSRAVLERLVGRPVRAMAAPGNHHDARVRRAVRASGYDAMFTSDRGPICPGDDPFTLRRGNISGRWSMRKFEAVLGSGSRTVARFRKYK